MTVDGDVVAEIERGLLVFVGVVRGDEEKDAEWLAKKVCSLRVFPEGGKMNLSVEDVGGALLLVSQFTLAADVRKGTRPSFSAAEEPGVANALFERVVERCREAVPCETGVFGADMQVRLCNDGPVTLWLDTR